MKHRCHRHINILLMKASLSGSGPKCRHSGNGMEDQLAVAEINSFWHAGCASGVKSGCPGVFIKIGKIVVVTAVGEKIFVLSGKS